MWKWCVMCECMIYVCVCVNGCAPVFHTFIPYMDLRRKGKNDSIIDINGCTLKRGQLPSLLSLHGTKIASLCRLIVIVLHSFTLVTYSAHWSPWFLFIEKDFQFTIKTRGAMLCWWFRCRDEDTRTLWMETMGAYARASECEHKGMDSQLSNPSFAHTSTPTLSDWETIASTSQLVGNFTHTLISAHTRAESYTYYISLYFNIHIDTSPSITGMRCEKKKFSFH